MTAPHWRLALSVQSIFLQAAFVGIRVMVGYRAIELGGAALFLGLLAASFAAPALVAALPVGQLAGRFGGARIAGFGISVMAIGTIAILILPGLPMLLVAGALTGLGYLAAMVGHQTFVAQRNSGGSADGDFGTLATAGSVGQLIGPPIVTTIVVLVDPSRPATEPNTLVGLLVALTCVLAAMPAWLALRRSDASWLAGRRPTLLDRDTVSAGEASAAANADAIEAEEAVDEAERATLSGSGPLAALRRNRGILGTPGLWRSLSVSAAVLVTMDLSYAFMPAWATERGIDVTIVGWLLAVRAAVSVLSRVGLARLVSRFGRKLLLIIAISVGVVALVALPFVGVPGGFIVMIALGVTLGLPQPVTLAWVIGVTEPRHHGAAVGLRMTSNRFAQIAIPILVSAIAGPLGVAGIFWANAVLLGAAVIVVAGSHPDRGRDDALASPGSPAGRS